MRAILSLSAVVALTGVLAACSSSPTDDGSSTEPATPVSVAPSLAAIERGGYIRFTGQVAGADGSRWTPADLTWRSSDPSVATVAPDGLVHGEKAGEAQIIVDWRGSSGVARVSVRDGGDSGSPCVQALVVGLDRKPSSGKCQ